MKTESIIGRIMKEKIIFEKSLFSICRDIKAESYRKKLNRFWNKFCNGKVVKDEN